MRVLQIIDRCNGETRQIPESDPQFMDQINGIIATVCENAGLNAFIAPTTADIIRHLDSGQEFITAGFLRKLA